MDEDHPQQGQAAQDVNDVEALDGARRPYRRWFKHGHGDLVLRLACRHLDDGQWREIETTRM
jgi:hypothetical protein